MTLEKSVDNEKKDKTKAKAYPFVDLVFNLPLQQTFTYQVPEVYQDKVTFGQRVIAPFQNRKLMGYVIKAHDVKPKFKLKNILELCDEEAIFDEDLVSFANWIADYYCCSFGEALSLCLPKECKEKAYQLKKVDPLPLLALNDEQQKVVDAIKQSIKDQSFIPYLLFGVTGSGKTEVYKYLAQEVVNMGKQALVLVPEIALTPQTITRFQSAFGDRIAILHSKLSQKERLWNWKQIQRGEVDIILGARSAIFSPFKRLGIIIIDEEHEQSYKSGDTPRYHTRQLAFKIGQMLKIPLVLGSATPSLETYYHGTLDKIKIFSLTKRHSNYQNLKMTLVDMKTEESKSFISKTLFENIVDRLMRKEQVMIFLNKRGYSPLLICQDCGSSLKCPNCDISLTYHQDKGMILCHYCNYSHTIKTICPQCEGIRITLIGYGTERIEQQLSELFVEAKIGRMDFDTTRKKGGHEKILSQFKKGDIDILVGTQMIAKGLHFPRVTLVGVVLADLSLHLPDFRAAERTFSLLTQISGRTGRGELEGGVIIQTYLPNNYVIQSAMNQDYLKFFEQEIEERKKFAYPPFSRFVKLLVRGKDEDKVIRKINDLFSQLKPQLESGVDILGPAPAPLSKINNNYRWQMILRGRNIIPLQKLSVFAQQCFKKENKLYLEIDIDPMALM